MRTVQMTLDDELVQTVDRVAKKTRKLFILKNYILLVYEIVFSPLMIATCPQ